MDVLTLLQSAREAGLEVNDLGDQLRIRGPKKYEPLVHQLLANKHAVLVELKHQAGWAPETAALIQWFLDKGQHLIPSEPFRLSPWQMIVNPGLFKEAILFGISMGPEKTRLRHGTFTADLRRLKELFGEETKPEENPK